MKMSSTSSSVSSTSSISPSLLPSDDEGMVNELRPIHRAQSFVDGHELAPRETSTIPRNRSLSDLQVRGAIFRRGPLEYNGCGEFLGTAPSRTKRDHVRCGNCGEYDHITVDCVLLGDESDSEETPSFSYLQKEIHRTNLFRESQEDARSSPFGQKIIPTTIPERMALQ
ncbi:Aste57867_13251 [Aphanomyces stellatus]|uniref:Aste57867_13251 protein n=1 Tax=Aphanomyces stellatus TaxID=120398 RepID=A0A485KXP0_9STRA|nr:hypothetical protein As57867_013202 [Aphanomyces stellatus]VFT90091.1 Aste57867_13251 [Aphanomyces stellatus]